MIGIDAVMVRVVRWGVPIMPARFAGVVIAIAGVTVAEDDVQKVQVVGATFIASADAGEVDTDIGELSLSS